MLTPNVCLIIALMSFSGIVFFWWHIWHYDRFRCLVPTRRDWFRTLICWSLIAGPACIFVYGALQTYVLYDQYFITISGQTIPKPWQLWPAKHQQIWKASLYIITVGWSFMQAVHLEEFLYWAYLMSTIRNPTGLKVGWVYSIQFKIWVGATLSGSALLIVTANIEKTDLNLMRAYIFIAGSAMSIVFALFSTALVIAMPSFIRAVRAQGAPYDVLDRLDFFTEMNGIRVLFRWVYAICFMILSADGLSKTKPINHSPFASDFLDMAGQVGVFVTACISLLLLLPRNMTSECLPASAQPQKMRMVAYPRRESRSVQHHLDSNGMPIAVPAVGTGSFGSHGARPTHAHQMLILGRRLNIDREAILDMAEDLTDAQEVKPSSGITKKPSYSSSGDDAEPSKDGFRASRSEEHINPNPTPDPISPGSESIASKVKRGVRWSEAPSLSAIPIRPPGSPLAGSMSSPRTRMRQSEVWVHTETVKHET